MKKYNFIKEYSTSSNNLIPLIFECREGWYPLILEAFDKIEEVINKMPLLDKLHFQENFEILQVKQKLGGLRIYPNFYNEEIEKIIIEAGEEAERTCEMCGQPGKMYEFRGWLSTNCETCFDKRKQEHILK